jgi:hypothetical protein
MRYTINFMDMEVDVEDIGLAHDDHGHAYIEDVDLGEIRDNYGVPLEGDADDMARLEIDLAMDEFLELCEEKEESYGKN